MEHKYIGFDAFGTLIEDKKANPYFKDIFKILNQIGSTKDIDFMTKNLPQNPREHFEQVISLLGKKPDLYKKEIEQLIEIFELQEKLYTLKSYSSKLIEKLKKEGKYVFLISNLSSLYVSVVKKLLSGKGIDRYFFSCEIGAKKNINEQKIFNQALLKIGALHGETIFTGDSIENDVNSPRKIGIKTYHIDDFVSKFST